MAEPPRADPDGYRIPLFDRPVYTARRHAAAVSVAGAGLDGLLVTIPENIYYLTGHASTTSATSPFTCWCCPQLVNRC